MVKIRGVCVSVCECIHTHQRETHLQNCSRRQELSYAMTPEGHQPLVSDCQSFQS